MNEEMTYEQFVACISHIDAVLSIMGLSCPDNVGLKMYQELNRIRNDLNHSRIVQLGNGSSEPFEVAHLNIT